MHSTFFQSGGAYGQSYSSTYGQGTHVAANTAVVPTARAGGATYHGGSGQGGHQGPSSIGGKPPGSKQGGSKQKPVTRPPPGFEQSMIVAGGPVSAAADSAAYYAASYGGYLPDMARNHAYAQHEPRYQHVDAGSGYVDGYAGANNDADYEMAMSAVAAEFPLSQQETPPPPPEGASAVQSGDRSGQGQAQAQPTAISSASAIGTTGMVGGGGNKRANFPEQQFSRQAASAAGSVGGVVTGASTTTTAPAGSSQQLEQQQQQPAATSTKKGGGPASHKGGGKAAYNNAVDHHKSSTTTSSKVVKQTSTPEETSWATVVQTSSNSTSWATVVQTSKPDGGTTSKPALSGLAQKPFQMMPTSASTGSKTLNLPEKMVAAADEKTVAVADEKNEGGGCSGTQQPPHLCGTQGLASPLKSSGGSATAMTSLTDVISQSPTGAASTDPRGGVSTRADKSPKENSKKSASGANGGKKDTPAKKKESKTPKEKGGSITRSSDGRREELHEQIERRCQELQELAGDAINSQNDQKIAQKEREKALRLKQREAAERFRREAAEKRRAADEERDARRKKKEELEKEARKPTLIEAFMPAPHVEQNVKKPGVLFQQQADRAAGHGPQTSAAPGFKGHQSPNRWYAAGDLQYSFLAGAATASAAAGSYNSWDPHQQQPLYVDDKDQVLAGASSLGQRNGDGNSEDVDCILELAVPLRTLYRGGVFEHKDEFDSVSFDIPPLTKPGTKITKVTKASGADSKTFADQKLVGLETSETASGGLAAENKPAGAVEKTDEAPSLERRTAPATGPAAASPAAASPAEAANAEGGSAEVLDGGHSNRNPPNKARDADVKLKEDADESKGTSGATTTAVQQPPPVNKEVAPDEVEVLEGEGVRDENPENTTAAGLQQQQQADPDVRGDLSEEDQTANISISQTLLVKLSEEEAALLDGEDLHLKNVEIDFYTAVLGGTCVADVYGEKHALAIPKLVREGDVLVFPGLGFTKEGRLIVTFQVADPPPGWAEVHKKWCAGANHDPIPSAAAVKPEK